MLVAERGEETLESSVQNATFSDEASKAQGSEGTCLSSQGQEVAALRLNPDC